MARLQFALQDLLKLAAVVCIGLGCMYWADHIARLFVEPVERRQAMAFGIFIAGSCLIVVYVWGFLVHMLRGR